MGSILTKLMQKLKKIINKNTTTPTHYTYIPREFGYAFFIYNYIIQYIRFGEFGSY